MSLLNNALREAEERQRRPDITGAYTGIVHEGHSGQRRLVVLVFLLAFGLAAAGLYWFVMMNPSAPERSEESVGERVEESTEERAEERAEESVQQGEVERAPAVNDEAIAPRPVTEPPEPKPPAPELPKSEAPKPQKPEPEAIEVQAASVPEPTADVSEPEPKPAQAPTMKTTPKSPRAIDRQTAKELESLVASGRMVEAERRLTSLIQTQAAPRSRFMVARALVVDGEIQRALNWLPEAVAAGDSTLRMLRARAQHADGRLDAAVATLVSNVPAVSEQPEYRVTLATLLQQQGQGQEAAAHWAELIAWNDSRAPWWVGLAIALEDQGETRGATRAYEQAVALPGLPPSLADYVQRRLQSLRAR
jgi:MSHA biogenesis protein MshN